MSFPSELALKGLWLIGSENRWDNWQWDRKRVVSHEGVDVRAVQYVPHSGEPDTWGEYPEGYQGVHSLIFEVTGPGDTRVLLRKDGSVSSYGRESWDGPIYEVVAVEKTVTGYEKLA
jgi:hypothetical protein